MRPVFAEQTFAAVHVWRAVAARRHSCRDICSEAMATGLIQIENGGFQLRRESFLLAVTFLCRTAGEKKKNEVRFSCLHVTRDESAPATGPKSRSAQMGVHSELLPTSVCRTVKARVIVGSWSSPWLFVCPLILDQYHAAPKTLHVPL